MAGFPGGGYLGNDSDVTDGRSFAWLVKLTPKGGFWSLMWVAAVGPDFGKVTFELSSLTYESAARAGNPDGKIDDDTVSYVTVTTLECYSAVASDTGQAGDVNLIVGGDEGDPLTSMTAGGTDPVTGVSIMDGGPGWYLLRARVNGKHASSTSYRFRVSELAVARRGDFDLSD